MYGLAFSYCRNVILETIRISHSGSCGIQLRHESSADTHENDAEGGGPDDVERPQASLLETTRVSAKHVEINGGKGHGIVMEANTELFAMDMRVLGTVSGGVLLHGAIQSAVDCLFSGMAVGIDCQAKGRVGDLKNVSILSCKAGELVIRPRGQLVGSFEDVRLSVQLEYEPGGAQDQVDNTVAVLNRGNVPFKMVAVASRLHRDDFDSDAAFVRAMLADSRATRRCTNWHAGCMFYEIPHYSCFSCNFTEITGRGLCQICRDEHAQKGCRVSQTHVEPLVRFFCDCDCLFDQKKE